MYKKRYWWYMDGPFRPSDEQERYPAPGEVLDYYLERKQMSQVVLAKHLGLRRSVIHYMLRGHGFDSLTRCHQLIAFLDIPPALLRLDAHHYPIE